MDKKIKNLYRRARKGDKESACKLLKMYYSDVYSYLGRLCSSKQDAEDLTQQTFLKVWSSLDSFTGHSKFSTWLYRIAHNTFIDWYRKNSGSVQAGPDKWWQVCVDENPEPFSNLARRQMAQRLYEAVDQLDEDKKHVVHLHYYQGLSIRQTAKVLGVATSTVKYRLREVFKILKVKLNVQKETFEQRKTIPIAKGELL